MCVWRRRRKKKKHEIKRIEMHVWLARKDRSRYSLAHTHHTHTHTHTHDPSRRLLPQHLFVWFDSPVPHIPQDSRICNFRWKTRHTFLDWYRTISRMFPAAIGSKFRPHIRKRDRQSLHWRWSNHKNRFPLPGDAGHNWNHFHICVRPNMFEKTTSLLFLCECECCRYCFLL
jgi:hypothetical protein